MIHLLPSEHVYLGYEVLFLSRYMAQRYTVRQNAQNYVLQMEKI